MTQPDPITPAEARVFLILHGQRVTPDQVAVLASVTRSEAREICERFRSRGIARWFGAYPDIHFTVNPSPLNADYRSYYEALVAAISEAMA